MTNPIRTRLAQFAGVALALFASSAVAAAVAQTPPSDGPSVAIVVGSQAGPEVVADATARARHLNAPLRVVRSSADELGATHLLAARGFDTVITVGVDRRAAVAPVAQRYPGTQFVAVPPGALGDYL